MYTSTASFLPENPDAPATGAMALAQQFGVNLGGDGTERSPQFYADLVMTNEILRSTVTKVYRSSSEDGEGLDLVTYYRSRGPNREARIERAVPKLRDDMNVRVNRETGVVSVSVTTKDAVVSEGIVTNLLELINTFDLSTRQTQARAERQFTGERLSQVTKELEEAEDSLKSFLAENRLFSNSPPLQFEHDRLQRTVFMRQELLTSLAQSYESARIEEVRNTPLVTLVEQPRVAALPDPRRRPLIVASGLVFGLMLGFFGAFLANYVERARKNGGSELEEFSSLWRDAKRGLRPFA